MLSFTSPDGIQMRVDQTWLVAYSSCGGRDYRARLNLYTHAFVPVTYGSENLEIDLLKLAPHARALISGKDSNIRDFALTSEDVRLYKEGIRPTPPWTNRG